MSQSSRKVFGIGLHRTGTTSLRRAFNILGLRCLENEGCWFMTDLDAAGKLIFKPTPEMHEYTAFADNPIPLFVAELDAMFPGSRFILTLRDVEKWADSVAHIFSAWWDSWRESPEWPLVDACHRAWYGTSHFDRQKGIEAYHRHDETMKAYFAHRPGDLLQLDMTQDNQWCRLCEFLGTHVPNVPYPNLNRRE